MSGLPGPNNRGLALAALVWTACVGAGSALVARHEFTPGIAAGATAWRGSDELRLAGDRPTLVMFLHPQCPCSTASINELARAMTLCGDRLAVNVVYFALPATQHATLPPGVRVIDDVDGKLIKQFDVHTSGQVLLFDEHGRLEFSGGITGSRGHEGDNAGLDAVVQLVNGTIYPPAQVVKTPVFGCAIAAPEVRQ